MSRDLQGQKDAEVSRPTEERTPDTLTCLHECAPEHVPPSPVSLDHSPGLSLDLLVEEKVADNGKICNDCNVHDSTVSANGFDNKQLEEDKVWNNHNA
jgi:hypothetical protein